ncbi:gluconokinase [Bifidobacterium crudilactis]|jgi:gluconokinase|uniref:gluconokinase n=1 Tax=Bifidobacterium crudilactis TaxID=327277 RepID=UPI0023522A75|nr:gluconokinase [Bifidobacterium crudilactis]MCI1218087.1 gluconokinase [Bifidobacterium crudilactis]
MTSQSNDSKFPVHVLVMGVAGCGKSTVAEAIRDQLGFTMAEGDDFHPKANIEKMSHGIPLTDEDRRPWLEVINRWMLGRQSLGESTVVSSSALKRAYRDILRKDVPVFFVHLVGSQELIQDRLTRRKGHFMPPALLPSQFAILEPLQSDEPGIEVSVAGTQQEMIDRAIRAVREHAASEESLIR